MTPEQRNVAPEQHNVARGQRNVAPGQQSGSNPRRGAPDSVATTNRINVALPFGTIRTQEASKELAELAGIVAELAALVRALSPEPSAATVHERARALASRLEPA